MSPTHQPVTGQKQDHAAFQRLRARAAGRSVVAAGIAASMVTGGWWLPASWGMLSSLAVLGGASIICGQVLQGAVLAGSDLRAAKRSKHPEVFARRLEEVKRGKDYRDMGFSGWLGLLGLAAMGFAGSLLSSPLSVTQGIALGLFASVGAASGMVFLIHALTGAHAVQRLAQLRSDRLVTIQTPVRKPPEHAKPAEVNLRSSQQPTDQTHPGVLTNPLGWGASQRVSGTDKATGRSTATQPQSVTHPRQSDPLADPLYVIDTLGANYPPAQGTTSDQQAPPGAQPASVATGQPRQPRRRQTDISRRSTNPTPGRGNHR